MQPSFLEIGDVLVYLLISIIMYFKRMSRDLQKQLNWSRWRDLFQKVSSSGFVVKQFQKKRRETLSRHPRRLVPMSAMWSHVLLKLNSVFYFSSLRVQLTSPQTSDRERNSRQPTLPVFWFRYQSVFCDLCKSNSVKHFFLLYNDYNV